MKIENVIYVVGIPNAGKDYTYSVQIDEAVLELYRYAEIERMVTGTNHVTVCALEYYDGPVDEEVSITLDEFNNPLIFSKNFKEE